MARIVLIDDEPAVRAALAAVLDAAGHAVRQAGDGEDGLQLLRAEPADVLLVDILMPGKEGVETILELRASGGLERTKVIAISGGGNLGAGECLEMARMVGAHRTLTKPIAPDELLGAIAELTG